MRLDEGVPVLIGGLPIEITDRETFEVRLEMAQSPVAPIAVRLKVFMIGQLLVSLNDTCKQPRPGPIYDTEGIGAAESRCELRFFVDPFVFQSAMLGHKVCGRDTNYTGRGGMPRGHIFYLNAIRALPDEAGQDPIALHAAIEAIRAAGSFSLRFGNVILWTSPASLVLQNIDKPAVQLSAGPAPVALTSRISPATVVRVNKVVSFESDAARVHRDIERFTAHMERAGVPGWERPKEAARAEDKRERRLDLFAVALSSAVIGAATLELLRVFVPVLKMVFP